jgi:hypothetical protein
MASSENELPGLTTEDSAQSSSGNMTDSDTQDHKSNNFAFMDQAFFYNLDQLAPDNPLFFMQQQQQQHGFDGQFITKDNENRSVATSLANSLESLRSAVAANTTEGEQPLSFWSGLNNVGIERDKNIYVF